MPPGARGVTEYPLKSDESIAGLNQAWGTGYQPGSCGEQPVWFGGFDARGGGEGANIVGCWLLKGQWGRMALRDACVVYFSPAALGWQ